MDNKQNNVIVQRKKSKINSGQGSQREARYPDLLVDWLSAARRTKKKKKFSLFVCNNVTVSVCVCVCVYVVGNVICLVNKTKFTTTLNYNT
jgi:hypothetical protein